jgi:hypothetical protein
MRRLYILHYVSSLGLRVSQMKVKLQYNSPVLLAGGLVVLALFGVIVIWARFKENVEVPRSSEWGETPTICPDDTVDPVALDSVVTLLGQHSLPVVRGPGPCDGSAAIHVHVSPADVDRVFPPEATMDGISAAGAFERTVSHGIVEDCEIYVVDSDDVTALAHETLHCLGFDHAVNPPAGHVMNRNYSRIGIRDWRGIP